MFGITQQREDEWLSLERKQSSPLTRWKSSWGSGKYEKRKKPSDLRSRNCEIKVNAKCTSPYYGKHMQSTPGDDFMCLKFMLILLESRGRN